MASSFMAAGVQTTFNAEMQYLKFRLSWSSIAMLWYEYTLTLPMEVKYMWGQKFRISTALYICCRYALIGNVLYLWANVTKTGNACDAWYKVVSTMAQFGRAAVIFTYIGRTYALTSGNRYVLAYLSTLGLVCISLGFAHVPGIRCVGGSRKPIINSLLDTFMCAFEFSAAIVTFVRCWQTRQVLKASMQRRNFFSLLVEQGVLYFAFTALFTIAWVCLNYVAPPGSFLQRCLNGFVIPLSCILTARFLLHLRAYKAKSFPHVESRRYRPPQSSSSSSSTISYTENFDISAELQFTRSVRSTIHSSLITEFGEDPVRSLERQITDTSGSTRV